MVYVGGVDCSGGKGDKNYSSVAWMNIETKEFILDAYKNSDKNWLPRLISHNDNVDLRYIGFDAPQGLSNGNNTRRICDIEAVTSSSVVPSTRKALKKVGAYKELIEMGLDIFWEASNDPNVNVYGLYPMHDNCKLTIFETYPRYVIKKWLSSKLTSAQYSITYSHKITYKVANPYRYVEYVWGGIQQLGYKCAGVNMPSVDQVDAMICAIVAEQLHLSNTKKLQNTVGINPTINIREQALQEGLILCP